ncbi:MAG: glycosyltransferase [Micromonosporaceae bacterium]|nr:glycosyltransferase [Micromonosporaceae bacterium]
MRVLALAVRYLPGFCAGAETMLHSMLRALAERGHQVDVSLSGQDGAPYDVDGVKVWPYVSKRDIWDHLPGADVVVSQLENSPRAASLGHWNGVPVVLVNHNSFLASKKVTVAPQGHVDLVVANSEWLAADLRDWYAGQRRQPPQIVVCRPLVDPAEHATTPGDRVTLVNLRVDEPNPDGEGAVGKGGALFRRLAERMPDIPFLGVTGAYGVQQDMSGLDNVEVLPHVPHDQMREQVWSRTRVLLVPSSYESWGRVGTEAICSGIPVVAHPTPGLRESLAAGGIFVDREDADAWAAAITDLSDPEVYASASARALARAAELDPAEDLARWCEAVEAIAGRRDR